MSLTKIPLVAFALCLGGCLISASPFFEDRDVVQDKNFIGSYDDAQEEVTWTVAPSNQAEGRYEVVLEDHEASSHFRGTLFRIGDGTYLDLISIGEIAVHIDESPSGAMPTVSQSMKQFLSDGQHFVFRVAVTAADITFWGARPDVMNRIPKEVFGPQPLKRSSYAVTLNRPTKELRAVLEKYGTGSVLFTEKKTLPKKNG